MSQLKLKKNQIKGIARYNAGIRKDSEYPPADGGKPVIEEGRKYWIPEDYNFTINDDITKGKIKNPIFAPDKKPKKED